MPRSRSLASILLASLVAAALGVVAWLALGDAPSTQDAAARAAARAELPLSTSSAAPDAPLATIPDEPAVTETPRAAETRAAVDAAAERELSQALWVEGRVLFPQGTPLDEELEVVADGRDFEHVGKPKGQHRVRVASDGAFRVAFSKATKSGALRLEGRYCFLDAPFKLKPSSPPADIVLEPLLGACIAGRITPPHNATDLESVRTKARVSSFGWAVNDSPQQRVAPIGEDWRYELRGLAVHRMHQVTFDPTQWTSFRKDSISVEAGKVLTLDVACSLGARITGRVVDTKGEPVGNATVQAYARTTLGQADRSSSRRVQSDAEGRFTLAGLQPGFVKVDAERDGFLSKELEVGEFADGQVREGLEVTLESGNAIRGVVKWDDGSPAERAWVQVEEKGAVTREFFGEPKGHKVDAEGRFHITGLGEGPYKVTASAAEGSKPQLDAQGAPVKTSKNSGPKWRAQIAAVVAGAELELVLRPGLSVAGVVGDDTGAPVTKFMVTAVANNGVNRLGRSSSDVVRKFEALDGSFVLEGLGAGAWSVTARAKGHNVSAPVSVQAPYDGPGLSLVVARSSRVAGLVVNSAGEPVPNASIQIDIDRRNNAFRMESEWRAEAGKDGRFELAEAPSGLLRIHAQHPKYARSPALEVRLAPAESLADVRLVLSEGGQVRGRIHESLLEPGSSWSVSLSGKQSDWQHTQAGSDGAFAFERLTPGEYQLSAHARLENDESAGGAKVTSRRSLNATVKVEAGATADVVLGAAAGVALELRGRVLHGGQPAELARIQVSRKGYSQSGATAADGSYSLQVDGAGAYTASVSLAKGASRYVQVEIAEGGPTTLDFEFDNGRIAGRVIDTSNEPVSRAMVQLSLLRPATEGRSGSQNASVQSDPAGAFELEGLSPGEYRLTVSDPNHFDDSAPRFGSLALEGVVVELGREQDELVLRVEPPASIRCRVKGLDGAPAIGATIDVRLPGGASAPRGFRTARTDGAGQCNLSGLATGEYVVLARLEDGIAIAAGVRVASAQQTEAQLDLRRGGQLEITRIQAEGASAKGKTSVVDATGFDWSLGASSWMVEGALWTLGPLPPGRYRVSASGQNASSEAVSASVAAGATASVTLQLTAP